MQGTEIDHGGPYVPRPRPTHFGRVICASFATVTVAAIVTITGCSLPTDTTPSRIVIPPTDELSTLTEVESSSTTSTTGEDTAQNLPDWTIGRVVALAPPRVDNSRFHQGSVTADSPLQDSSGFHFSTPDRSVNCSTGTNGRSSLVCRINDGADSGPSRRREAPSTRRHPATGRPITQSSVRTVRNMVRAPIAIRFSIALQ